jgi:copper chaperone|tara:strand:- start:1738 stop:1947 length:210 start_codon:yes stop_codon:yes gene_type:complete
MSAKTTEFKVEMMCEGCVGAVKRILAKVEGVDNFDVVLETKKVTVTGSVEPSTVIEKLNKAGKSTEIWS